MMAHTNGVGVRKTKTKFTLNFGMILDDNIAFSTNILGGCLHVRPNAGFEFAAAFMVDHGILS